MCERDDTDPAPLFFPLAEFSDALSKLIFCCHPQAGVTRLAERINMLLTLSLSVFTVLQPSRKMPPHRQRH
ncbi:MAG: hypothetical protein GPOALKHO_000966 [Sodalis sp.]|nr:MAG: hypothetical protein GPOALKHO_000966 [Sodalis sp.]